ncbi:MAG: tetratricopeptide repeat protein [Acidobacteria bacterium]|nr:tetratricopeptide repeat protein [Acidobacteriota bacterium]MBV9478066.1 tetratricopeptide repeat protein [Acidobacteriota bacterium]
MRAYVLTDASLERYAGRFVWLSLNTEDAKSASFLKKYPIPALPTLLVLDAKRDAVTMRYVGGATVPQLRKMLDDAEKTYRAKSLSSADQLLARANALASAGKDAEAAKLFDQALGNAPKGWNGYGRTAESLLFSLSMARDAERCTTRALDLYPRVKGTSSAAGVAASGLSCAIEVDEKNPKRAQWIATLEKDTREVFDDHTLTLSGDDRSGLYMSLIDARDDAKDEAGAKKLRGEWAAFLEKSAAAAKTAEQRAVYDSHRLAAYLDLGTPEKAIPMLEQSQRDFPDDYNPPARLALAYNAMKEYDKALAASDRALARVYGPRKLVVLTARADIYTAKGDTAAARATMQQAIDYAKSLPEGQRSDGRIASLEKRLAAMKQ